MKSFFIAIHICVLTIAATDCFAQRAVRRELGAPFLQGFGSQEYGRYVQHLSIVQDRRSIMYFATNDGVLEFDGVSWRLIPTTNQSIVRCVAISASGRICVGALNEIGFLAPDSSGSMRYVSLLPRIDSTQREFGAIRYVVSTFDDVFFLSRSHLFRWNESRSLTRSWKSNSNVIAGFAVRNQLYVQQENVGLLALDGDSLRPCSNAERVANARIYFILPFRSTSEREILIGTRQGLYVYDGDSLRRFETDADELLSEYRVQHGAYLPDGSLALATERRGVMILDQSGRVRQILDKSSGLKDVHVKFIFVDRQGGMWLGLNNSIARYEVSSPSTMFLGTPGMENGVVGLTRHKGTLYASTGLGIYYLQPARTPSELPAFKHVNGITAQCGALLSAGGILFAGTGDGIFTIEGDKSRFAIAGVADQLYVSPNDSSHIYIGFYDGLGLMRVANSAFEFYGRVPAINVQVQTIVEDSAGTAWMQIPYQGMLSVRGLRWSKSVNVSHPEIHRYFAEEGFRFGSITPILVKGKLLFETTEGLRRLDPSRQAFLPDSTFGATFADTSSTIGTFVADERGNLWTQRFAQGSLEFGALAPRNNGMYEWESHALAAGSSFGPVWALHRDADDGVIWLGGTNGVLRYDARQSNIPETDFSTLFRRVAANDSLLFGGFASESTSAQPSLSHDYNSLRFEFSASNYSALPENQYQYYLDGFEATWSGWSKEPHKEYTNLPAGHFTFHVRSKYVHGGIGKVAAFAFSILPPFWETWWFRSIAFLLFASIGPLIYYRRVKQLKEEQQRQQDFARQIMESQEAERKRIANELHDSLGQNLLVIKNRSALAAQAASENPKAMKQLNEIEATVTDAIKEVRHIAQNLHPYQLEAIGLSAAIRSMLTKVAESTDTRIVGEVDDIDGTIEKNEEINIYRIIQEGLNNILKHAEAKNASVVVQKNERSLLIQIKDDGKGFAMNGKSEGMGMKDIAERARIMNGSFVIDSSPGGGTTVDVRVPVL
jgi:signal transduction histidine kinase